MLISFAKIFLNVQLLCSEGEGEGKGELLHHFSRIRLTVRPGDQGEGG
jgi:hypothetical protein